jgi:hypothetical protein
VLQTYADKLLAADQRDGYVRADTARLASAAYRLAGECVERAEQLTSNPGQADLPRIPDALPHWHTPIRSPRQLVGMRETLEALRTYVAYDIARLTPDDRAARVAKAGLVEVDAKLESVDRLWIERPPDAIRGGIGTALTTGLDAAYAVGKLLAGP